MPRTRGQQKKVTPSPKRVVSIAIKKRSKPHPTVSTVTNVNKQKGSMKEMEKGKEKIVQQSAGAKRKLSEPIASNTGIKSSKANPIPKAKLAKVQNPALVTEVDFEEEGQIFHMEVDQQDDDFVMSENDSEKEVSFRQHSELTTEESSYEDNSDKSASSDEDRSESESEHDGEEH